MKMCYFCKQTWVLINEMIAWEMLRYQREMGAYRARREHRLRTLTRSRKKPPDVQIYSSRQLLNSPRSLSFRSSTASFPPHSFLSMKLSISLRRSRESPAIIPHSQKPPVDNGALYISVCAGRFYLACSQAFDDGHGYVHTYHEEGHSSQAKNICRRTMEILTNTGWGGGKEGKRVRHIRTKVHSTRWPIIDGCDSSDTPLQKGDGDIAGAVTLKDTHIVTDPLHMIPSKRSRRFKLIFKPKCNPLNFVHLKLTVSLNITPLSEQLSS